MITVIVRCWRFLLKNRWKVILAAIVLLPVAGLAAFAFAPDSPEYVTEKAVRGDLRQTVEAVGTVISERDLELQFPVTGIVANVYVTEGDVVRQGQRLAALRAGNLAADIASAVARLQSAQADLRELLEGSRPEDIAVAEAEVESKRASLESARTSLATAESSLLKSEDKLAVLRTEAQTGLSGYVAAAESSVTEESTTALNALSTVRDVFNNNDVIDAIVKEDPSEYDQVRAALRTAEQTLEDLARTGQPADYEAAIAELGRARSSIADAVTATNLAFSVIDGLSETSSFTAAQRQTYKETLTTQRSALQASLSDLDADLRTIRDASATYATRIATEESALATAQGAMDKAKSDITTYEATLRIAQAQLQLKRAPVRATDIAASQASVRQAAASLQRAQADYANTVITAPIAGRITKVNVKVGEAVSAGPVITMLGDSPYRIEMYVSEIDIPNVRFTQTGSIELDAFKGIDFRLHVSVIDAAPTDRDGVSKYRVRLDFAFLHEELKIGMTGDVTIVTALEHDVVSVPARALLEREDGASFVRVLHEDGSVEERAVRSGLEGEGGRTSVSGIEEGETVIVLEKQ